MLCYRVERSDRKIKNKKRDKSSVEIQTTRTWYILIHRHNIIIKIFTIRVQTDRRVILPYRTSYTLPVAHHYTRIRYVYLYDIIQYYQFLNCAHGRTEDTPPPLDHSLCPIEIVHFSFILCFTIYSTASTVK